MHQELADVELVAAWGQVVEELVGQLAALRSETGQERHVRAPLRPLDETAGVVDVGEGREHRLQLG